MLPPYMLLPYIALPYIMYPYYITTLYMYLYYYIPAHTLHTYIHIPPYEHSLITTPHIWHTQALYKHIDIWGINISNIIQRFNMTL